MTRALSRLIENHYTHSRGQAQLFAQGPAVQGRLSPSALTPTQATGLMQTPIPGRGGSSTGGMLGALGWGGGTGSGEGLGGGGGGLGVGFGGGSWDPGSGRSGGLGCSGLCGFLSPAPFPPLVSSSPGCGDISSASGASGGRKTSDCREDPGDGSLLIDPRRFDCGPGQRYPPCLRIAQASLSEIKGLSSSRKTMHPCVKRRISAFLSFRLTATARAAQGSASLRRRSMLRDSFSTSKLSKP